MSEKNVNNGQNAAFAFSVLDSSNNDGRHTEYYTEGESGLSKREYAAIHLRVPDSGEEWLDEMIKKANRVDAIKEFTSAILNKSKMNQFNIKGMIILGSSYADELLKQENHE